MRNFLFVCLFPKQKLVLSLSSFPPPQFHMCTWQLSIALRWLWNNTGEDSKANKHGTGCRRLKLSLRVIFKGIIFSFPYASRLCCSHYLSEWQPQILKCYSYMNCIGSSSGSIQEARWDAKIYYAHKCASTPRRKNAIKVTSVKPQKYML